jgi:hypothetical protein
MGTETVRQLRRTAPGEERWFELLQDVGHYRLSIAFMQAADVAPQVAATMVMAIEDRRHGVSRLSGSTLTRFRRLFKELDVDTVRDLANRAIPRQFNPGTAQAA